MSTFISACSFTIDTEVFNPAPGDTLFCKVYIQPASADLNFTPMYFSSDPKE